MEETYNKVTASQRLFRFMVIDVDACDPASGERLLSSIVEDKDGVS